MRTLSCKPSIHIYLQCIQTTVLCVYACSMFIHVLYALACLSYVRLRFTVGSLPPQRQISCVSRERGAYGYWSPRQNAEKWSKISLFCDHLWPNTSEWGWYHPGTKLWFWCLCILQESRIILTQKSFWYHFPFQRYEKTKLIMLEFQEFKNPCF